MNNDINELEIKIFPLILEAEAAAGLWHLLRAIDVEGRGAVSLTMEELVDAMKLSQQTIYRYLKSPLFRTVPRSKDTYTIYLKSLKKVKELLGIKDLTTMSYGKIEHIRNDRKKQTVAEILIASLQCKSYHKARKESKGRNIIPLDEVFNPSNSMKGVKVNDYQVYFNSDFYAPYGASQNTIAKLLGKTRKTISKRLENTEKKKQRFTYSEIQRDYKKAEADLYAGGFITQAEIEAAFRNVNRFITSTKDNKTIFKKYCNLYNVSGWVLRSGRSALSLV